MGFDVIVVGAGPAGSTAAYEAANLGLDVLLLEKYSLPRVKPCGGAVMQRALQLIHEGVPEDIIERRIFGLKFVFPSSEQAEFSSKEQIGITVFREKFDEFLARRAARKGATLLENAEVIDAWVDRNSVGVALKDGTKFTGSYLIGADGVNSVISRSLGLRPKRKDQNSVGLGMESNIFVGEEMVEEAMRGHPEILQIVPARHRVSYGWVFAKKEHLAIGVAGAGAHMHPLRSIFNHFHKRMEKHLGITLPVEKRYTYFLGGKGLLGPNVTERALLVGDAAGFVDPLMGEGIAYAMQSGIFAAETINQCRTLDEYSTDFLASYHSMCNKEFCANFQTAEFFGTRGTEFAEWLLTKAKQHPLSERILVGLARGTLGYAQIPLVILRHLPSEIPSLIQNKVQSWVMAHK